MFMQRAGRDVKKPVLGIQFNFRSVILYVKSEPADYTVVHVDPPIQ